MNTILLRKKTIPGNKKLKDDCFDIFAFIWKLKYLRYENDACLLQHYKIPQKRFSFLSLTMVWKVPIKNFFSKCDQIRKQLQIWSHLMKKSLMESFIFRLRK